MAIDLLPLLFPTDNSIRALRYVTPQSSGHEFNQSQLSDGHYYHVKGGLHQPCAWERFHLAKHNGVETIWRTADTSESQTRMYLISQNRDQPHGKGAPWLPRFVEVGQSYPFAAYIQHFNKQNGDKLNSGDVSYPILVKELRRPYTSPGGVTLPAAVVLQVGGFDEITYGGGLVEFRNNAGFHSYIDNANVQPNKQLEREVIQWLTLPPIDTPAPRPTETLRITTPKDGLNFRQSPGLLGTKIDVIEDGEMIERFTDVGTQRANDLDWYNIRRQGVDGWVAKVTGVEFTNPASPFARLRGLLVEALAELDRVETTQSS